MEKVSLLGLSPTEITEVVGLKPAFRGKQVFNWISKGASSFLEMTNLDKKSIALLEEKALIFTSFVSDTLKDKDGTIKLQITLNDKRAIETVLLTDDKQRKTACVSCQAGCAMGCAFCQTGTLGLGRNLSAGEIVEEFLFLEKEAGTLDNIVFMGMGEPLQNLNAIQKAIEILSHPEGRNLGTRRITLSTCGLIDGIYRLADSSLNVRLAVSLTTANQALRERLMPVAKGNPIPKLKEAIRYYAQKKGKRITLEVALLSGINTDKESALNLIDFAKGLDVYINVIPWNKVGGLDFSTPLENESKNFIKILDSANIPCGLRLKRGSGIAASCGQLGKSFA